MKQFWQIICSISCGLTAWEVWGASHIELFWKLMAMAWLLAAAFLAAYWLDDNL